MSLEEELPARLRLGTSSPQNTKVTAVVHETIQTSHCLGKANGLHHQHHELKDREIHVSARDGPLEQLADVADTLNRLAPGLEALAPTIETLREAVATLSMVVNPLSNIAERIPIPGRRRSAPRALNAEIDGN